MTRRPCFELESVKNLSTGVNISTPSRGKSLEATECSDETIVFCATGAANVGQLISLSGNLKSEKMNSKFEATGRVTKVLPGDEHLTRFEIHLHQFDKQLWFSFLERCKKSQVRADRIFDSIRGDDEA